MPPITPGTRIFFSSSIKWRPVLSSFRPACRLSVPFSHVYREKSSGGKNAYDLPRLLRNDETSSSCMYLLLMTRSSFPICSHSAEGTQERRVSTNTRHRAVLDKARGDIQLIRTLHHWRRRCYLVNWNCINRVSIIILPWLFGLKKDDITIDGIRTGKALCEIVLFPDWWRTFP